MQVCRTSLVATDIGVNPELLERFCAFGGLFCRQTLTLEVHDIDATSTFPHTNTHPRTLLLSTGVNCRDEVQECLSQPCLNDGRCVDLRNGFECECAAGWTGFRCQIDVDECVSQPCRNGGACA